jgi:hypothetical protein
MHRKLLRSPFTFQNYTKMTKYEALEKNVVSNHKLPSLRQSLVRSFTWNVSVCWGFWGGSTELNSRLPGSMAEGEELGSNLLRVAQSSPGYPGGSGSFGRDSRKPLRQPGTFIALVVTPDGPPNPVDGQVGSPMSVSRTAPPKPVASPLIDRIGGPWARHRLPDDGRQLEHLSPQILYIST